MNSVYNMNIDNTNNDRGTTQDTPPPPSDIYQISIAR